MSCKKEKIKDLSPLLIEFLQQEKKIYLLDSGTGFGKSYSLNIFMNKVLMDKTLCDKTKKIYYITDRNYNIDQEYNDLIKQYPSQKNNVLRIKNNLDSIIDNEGKKLHNLSKKFKSLPEYKSLEELRKEYEISNNLRKKGNYDLETTIIETQLRKHEAIFRKKVKDILFKEYPKFETLKYKEKINFIKRDPDLRALLDLYPTMLSQDKKILFLTIDKFFLPFDTIVDKNVSYLYQNKNFIENSIVLLDESDAMADRILDKIIEQSSRYPIDIIDKIYNFCKRCISNNEVSKTIPTVLMINKKGKDNISADIVDIIEQYKILKEKFYIDYSIIFEEYENVKWLFATQNQEVIYKANNDNLQIKLDEKKKQAYITKEEKKNFTTDNNYTDFVNLCILILHKIYGVIKKMANNYCSVNSEFGETTESATEKILSFLHMIDSQDNESLISLKDYIKHINESSLNTSEYKEDDYYSNPGNLIKTEVPDNRNFMIKLNSYNLLLTPEKFLKTLIDNNSKIILSSATSKNKSILRNFNLEWPCLQKEIFTPSKKSQELEKKYYNEREQNKNDVNIITKVVKDKNIDEILELVSTEKQSLARKILEALEDEDQYRASICYRIIFDIFSKLKEETSVSLFFSTFNLVDATKEDQDWKGYLKKFIEDIIKKEYEDFCSFYVNSEKMERAIEGIKMAAKQNKKCFIFTSYETAQKGLNLKINRNVSLADIVWLNDFGKKEFFNNLNTENQLSDVVVDIDGIYLGEITNIYPSLENVQYTESILKNAHYAQSLEYNSEISQKELNEVMNRILVSAELKKKKYPFSVLYKNGSKTNAYIYKVISVMIQALGRKCRCNIKMKNNHISIDGALLKKIEGRIDLNEEIFEKQPFEIKKIFQDIASLKIIEKPLVNPNIIRIKQENIQVAINENWDGHPLKLKKLHSLNAYSVSGADFKKLALPKDMYMKVPNALIGADGYSCGGYESTGEAFSIFPLHTANKREISLQALNLGPKEKRLLEGAGMSFSLDGFQPDGYIISPNGFDVLAGKIGEILGRYFLQEYISGANLCNLHTLPDPIYERMDDYIEYDNGIFVVDYKYKQDSLIAVDSYDINREHYQKKFLEIKRYFNTINKKNKPIIGLVINIRSNDDASYINKNVIKFDNKELEDSLCVCVPNIYNKDGSINYDIFNSLRKILENKNLI